MQVHYKTFGCKANQYDTARIRQELEARGADTVGTAAAAHLVVVNTCTVTNQADADARRFIRRVCRERPDARVVAVGCSVALREDEYLGMPGVAATWAGHDPVGVAQAVRRARPTLVQLQARTSLDRVDQEPVGADILLRREGSTRGWLKIQDGCDRKCSFCATRLARGSSRSRSPDQVVREARQLSSFHPELVLTGIHIGHYGRDLDPSTTLSRLVSRLLEAVPNVRLRLGSIEATEVDDLLLGLMEESGGRLAPHFHMPLQSGSDPVLRRMRRWHTREMYRSRALEIADRMTVLGLGADIITGYPGETDEDHRSTVALVEELPFTYLHVFPFSPRDGTEAANANARCPVPQRVSGERSRELREIALAKGITHRRSRSGDRATVVIEGDGGAALTGDYLRINTEIAESGARAGSHAEASNESGRSGLREGTLTWRGEDLTIDLTGSAGFN